MSTSSNAQVPHPGSAATITLYPGEKPAAVDRAEEAMVLHAEAYRVFQRGVELVRIISLAELERGGGLIRPTGTVQLEPLSPMALMEILDRIIKWQVISPNGEDKTVDCPRRIAVAYLSRIGDWHLPVLTGIIAAPILRPDGTVLSHPGYDAGSGLFLATNELWEIPDQPTRDDAKRGIEILTKPFDEFPFVSSADRSVLTAAILTSIQRRMLRAAPLFAFSAPTPRMGKSLLAEVVAILATGRPAPATAVSSVGEELRKVITAVLREGHQIVNLDNIEGPLASPDLARAITQAEYSDRELGKSRQLRLATDVLWTATGNNLTLRGDLTKRALLCQIDSGRENPEERRFTIPDLRAFVTENRKRLVVAALTILRAFQVAGRPRQSVPQWGGFEDWSMWVREPLVWLGLPDPFATREYLIGADPDREEAVTLLKAWHNALAGKRETLREVWEAAKKDSVLKVALHAVIRDQKGLSPPEPQRLGYWCRSWRFRVLDGFRLCSDEKRTKSGSRWWVEKVAD